MCRAAHTQDGSLYCLSTSDGDMDIAKKQQPLVEEHLTLHVQINLGVTALCKAFREKAHHTLRLVKAAGFWVQCRPYIREYPDASRKPVVARQVSVVSFAKSSQRPSTGAEAAERPESDCLGP